MDTDALAASEDDWPPVLPVLHRRRLLLVVGALLGVGLSLLYVFGPAEPAYTSRAEVLVEPPVDGAFAADWKPSPNMANERQVLYSDDVATLVKSRTGWPESMERIKRGVASAPIGDSEVLEITYRDRTAQRARQGALAYAASFLDYRLRQAAQTRATARNAVATALAGVQRRMRDVIGARASTADGSSAGRDDSLQSLSEEAQQYHDRLAGLDSVALERAGVVVDFPDLPHSPSSPNPVPFSAAGAFLGLIGAVFVALARERIEPRLRDRADVEAELGAPVLATVPRWRRSRRSGPTLVMISHPHSPTAEAYRRLRAVVLAMAKSHRVHTIMVTSPTFSSAKSAVAGNLAVALTRAGRAVSVVGAALPDDELQHLAGLERLAILPAGRRAHSLAEVPPSEVVQQLLDERRQAVDFVIIDGPPVLTDPDALLLASLVDGVVVVADGRQTTRKQLGEVRGHLDQIDVPVLGAVVCNAGPR